MKDNEFDYTPDLVTLNDDEGNEYQFEILDAIETDEGRYLAMLPYHTDPQEKLEEDGDLVVVKVEEDESGEYLMDIEDDDEYETVSEAFIERLRDYYEIDEQ